MKPSLKLSIIDREHLQELYDAAGIPRDQLPYTPAFEQVWQGFQDRTFKNADHEQVYGALIKYVRSSTNPTIDPSATKLSDEQIKQLKSLLPRHAAGGKVLPYSSEFDAVRKEFSRLTQTDLSELEFWQAILRTQGARRRPPRRTKAVQAETEDQSDSDDE